jgi:hypothetical protein
MLYSTGFPSFLNNLFHFLSQFLLFLSSLTPQGATSVLLIASITVRDVLTLPKCTGCAQGYLGTWVCPTVVMIQQDPTSSSKTYAHVLFSFKKNLLA